MCERALLCLTSTETTYQESGDRTTNPVPCEPSHERPPLMIVRRVTTMLGLAALLTTLSACGSPSDSASIAQIAPASPDVEPGGTIQFIATVGGMVDESAAWSVLEPAGGSIDAAGSYIAPATEGTYTVLASFTSLATTQSTAVRVKRNIRVDVSPSAATLAAGESLVLSAAVTGDVKTVTWSVAEADGGTVTADGVYTAPQTAGTYNVVATSTVDPSKQGMATITATAPPPPPPPPPTVAIAVTPQTASAVAGNTVQFTATVTGSTDGGVTWSVAESGAGTVNATGLYTAPATAGTYHVVAASHADTSTTATAAVTVSAPAPTGVPYPPNTTLVHATQPSMSEPALGASALFTDLGTTVTHVSDGRHHYSKTSVWNVDESYAMLNDGSILNGTTYAYIRTVSRPNEHKTWSNTDPRYIYGVTTTDKSWRRVDVTTNSMTVLATYPQYSSLSYGHYEGNMDDNDTGVALIGSNTVPFIVNPKTGAFRCAVSSGGGWGRTISDSTMSHDGNYMLVNWDSYGVDAYRASDCGFVRKLTSSGGHYDACVSQAGDQVYASASGPMIRISDGQVTQLWSDSAYRNHITCRNTRRPGWAYVSVYNTTCDSTVQNTKAYHRIFAVKLDGSGTVEDFAWDHEACPSTYDTTTMAVPSRLGNRVWWKVNWGGSSSLHSFVAERR